MICTAYNQSNIHNSNNMKNIGGLIIETPKYPNQYGKINARIIKKNYVFHITMSESPQS